MDDSECQIERNITLMVANSHFKRYKYRFWLTNNPVFLIQALEVAQRASVDVPEWVRDGLIDALTHNGRPVSLPLTARGRNLIREAQRFDRKAAVYVAVEDFKEALQKERGSGKYLAAYYAVAENEGLSPKTIEKWHLEVKNRIKTHLGKRQQAKS